MIHKQIGLLGKKVDGYVIPCGAFNLVMAVTGHGLIGCGAFDVKALEKFNYPAASVRPSQGDSIATLDNLLEGIVKEANVMATRLGIFVGMSGKEALKRL